VKNCTYNVVHALAKEQRGLYAINKHYLKDAKKDKHKGCEGMWKRIAKHKKAIVAELKAAAKSDIK